MSSFTDTLIVEAVPRKRSGWRRWLPPGFVSTRWKLVVGFRYAVGSLDAPTEVIEVKSGFPFDGASVPFYLRLFVPMAHSDYMQAAALHDWMLSRRRYPRRYSDKVFAEALAVLGMPRLWRALMYSAVRIASMRAYLIQKIRGDCHAS